MNQFEIIFLAEAREFLLKIDEKSRNKIIFNIDKSKILKDKNLFKKLEGEIWEFRTLFNKTQYRIFAFWDKQDHRKILVLATHGIIKKSDKIRKKEIRKAKKIKKKKYKRKKINKKIKMKNKKKNKYHKKKQI